MDKFDIVSKSSFCNATGNDAFPLQVGSKGDRVYELQNALSRLGAIISIDGAFGTKTKTVLTSKGFAYPVTESVFNQVQSKAFPNSSSSNPSATITEDEMRKLWSKDRSKYGRLSSEPDFDRWLKRQKTLANIKSYGQNLFGVAKDWLSQKQGGGDYVPENTPVETDTSRIMGMPKGVVIGGGIVLGVLAIWGIWTIASKSAVRQSIPAPRPAGI